MRLKPATIYKRLKALEVADGKFLSEAQQWALEAYSDLKESYDMLIKADEKINFVYGKFAQETDASYKDRKFAQETEASRSSILQGAVPARLEKTGVLTDMDQKISDLLSEVDTMTDIDALRSHLKQQLRDNRATRAWMRVWRKNSKNITGEIDSHLAGESLKPQE